MTTDDLKDRALENFPGGRVQFGPWTILVLGSILSAVITHYVEKCLDRMDTEGLRAPSWWERRKLRWRICRACRDAEDSPEALALGEHGKGLDGAYGDRLHQALLATAASLQPTELLALKAAAR